MYSPIRISAGLVAALLSPWIAAQETPSTPPASAPADTESASRIDAQADQRVKAMSDFLGKQQKFRFSVEITYDSVEDDGQKIQLGRRSRVEVMRPNGLRAESQGDRGLNQIATFDGHHFLFYNRAQNVYSRVETPPTLPEFFDFLFEKYGASPPLVDFLLPDVHGALTSNAKSISLLGDAFVAEKDCDHIAFSGDTLDWQVWIEKGATPWPRKFVITYKDVDVRPQFMAVFREWEADAKLDASHFATTPPAGATEIPMQHAPDENSSDEAANQSNGHEGG